MTEYTKRIIIVITSGQLRAANAKAKMINTIGGEFAWTVGLSPNGVAPATHYWNNWQMKPDEFNNLMVLLAEIPGNKQVFELDNYDSAVARPSPEEVLDMTVPRLKRIKESV